MEQEERETTQHSTQTTTPKAGKRVETSDLPEQSRQLVEEKKGLEKKLSENMERLRKLKMVKLYRNKVVKYRSC